MGATRSSEAMRMPISASSAVRSKAKLGSPFKPVLLKKFRKLMRLSLAIACIRRGAPVKVWSAAPKVEEREPMRMIQREGQASRDTVRPAASPNWSSRRKRRIVEPKNSTQVRSELHVKENTCVLYWLQI